MVSEVAPAAAACTKKIKEIELSEDEDDVDYISAAAAVEQDEHLTEPEHFVAWDSSEIKKIRLQSTRSGADDTSSTTLSAAEQLPKFALDLKDQGNAAFRKGDAAKALALYKQALEHCNTVQCNDKSLLATLHSNVAAALLKLGKPADAISACRHSHSLRPNWTKPLHRLAEAHYKCREYAAAVLVCQKGETLCSSNSEGHTEFTPMLDRLAVEAALQGSFVGYTGRQLEVRSAGDEAWLGRPAPHVPALDGPLTEETALPSDDLTAASSTVNTATAPKVLGLLPSSSANSASQSLLTTDFSNGSTKKGPSARVDGLSTWQYADTLAATSRQRTSFRCIKEAMAAARDGDRILLLKGIHNGMGQTVDVTKRVLIDGEGAVGETVIDQRANCPTFRILRGGAVIRNLDFDHTGFREALLIEVKASGCALIDGCVIKCSGDDAVNVAGQAAPLLRRCAIIGKKCGIRAFEQVQVRLEGCVLEKCGEQGMKAMEQSKIDATLCMLRDCEEEGAIAMQCAQISMLACTVSGNKGPGVDCSDKAVVHIRGGEISKNVGGVWLWDESAAVLDGVRLDGGRAPVILADGNARPQATSCVIKGTVHASDDAWRGLLASGDGGSNRLEDPDVPTDFPPEEGPFKFVPNRFTRKQ